MAGSLTRLGRLNTLSVANQKYYMSTKSLAEPMMMTNTILVRPQAASIHLSRVFYSI